MKLNYKNLVIAALVGIVIGLGISLKAAKDDQQHLSKQLLELKR